MGAPSCPRPAQADVSRQGAGWEANPLMALAQAHLGTPWWVPKLMLVALAGIAALSTRVRRSRVTLIVAASWVRPVSTSGKSFEQAARSKLAARHHGLKIHA